MKKSILILLVSLLTLLFSLPSYSFAYSLQIAAGVAHSVALKDDGTVRAWGDNRSGQLGNGEHGYGYFRSKPVQVNGMTNVQTIAAGGSHTVTLKDDTTVWAWGENWAGQLGDCTTISRSTAVQVYGLTFPWTIFCPAIIHNAPQ